MPILVVDRSLRVSEEMRSLLIYLIAYFKTSPNILLSISYEKNRPLDQIVVEGLEVDVFVIIQKVSCTRNIEDNVYQLRSF